MAISLDSIVSGQRIMPPKLVIYGVGGIGKTTLASMAPNPILIQTEDGLGKLETPRFTFDGGAPVAQSWNEILEAVGFLYENKDHDRQTVIIDTLDFAEPLLWAHTAAMHNQEDIEAFGYGKGYIYACDEARILLQGLDALRNERGMAVILLAHSDTKKYDAPDHEPYDRYKLRLQDRFAHLVHDWSDAMLFANWKVHIVKDTRGQGKDKKETARGVGTGERVMYTEERPAWWAKNRYGLPFEMPLSWSALQDAIAAGVIPEKKPARKTTRKAATAAKD